MEARLGEYQRRRDDATANGFRLTLSAASLDPLAPHLQGSVQAASTRPEAVTRIIGVLGGSTPLGGGLSRRITAELAESELPAESDDVVTTTAFSHGFVA